MSMPATPRALHAKKRLLRLLPHDHPDGVDYARNVAAQRQQDVEPELQAEADLEKHADGRQEDCEENSYDVQDCLDALMKITDGERGWPKMVQLRQGGK
jgi:hypothetical protein